MKKIVFLLITLICALSLITGVSSESAPRLNDGAELLEDSEEAALLARLNELSDNYKIDVVAITVADLGDKLAAEYADDYFDAYDFGYGNDGILMLYCPATDEGWLSTSGKGIDIFNDSYIDAIGGAAREDLDSGDVAGAIGTFADECEYYLDGEINGWPFNYGMSIVISAVVGLIAAAIVGSKLKGELKTVRSQAAATSYVKDGGINLTASNDFYLYRNVVRTEKKTESSNTSTHTSSSGNTHGGGGF